VNCISEGSVIDAAILENVNVYNLRTKGLLQCFGALFKGVSIAGNIGRVMISPQVLPSISSIATQDIFIKSANEFYSKIEWALDIRNANFLELDIRGIPADLIIRDRESQVVVRKHRVLDGSWRELDLSGTYWKAAIEMFINRPYDSDLVLVAPKRSKDFGSLLSGLKLLRDAGIAEKD
jgi:hypothetical protein